MAALLRLAQRGIGVEDIPEGIEEDPASAVDVLEGGEEAEECGDEDAVKEDEEEVNVDVTLAACLEDKAVIEGTRRSSRLAGTGR